VSNSSAQRDHYSYAVYADPDTARSFDSRRFGGPIGALVAAREAAVLERFAGDLTGRSVLDVGTGTGRAAFLCASKGARVTAVDASSEMLAMARQRAAERSAPITFALGDAHALDFADRAFDVVVSLRVLMHAVEWRACLSELCRVAGRLVIFDYPAACSAALVQSLTRRVLHRTGVRTEPYRVFTDRQIGNALAESGFRIRGLHRQFVLPIALHKAIGSRRLTELSEAALERAGLLKAVGSPVTIVAERCTIS
jgi:ubiquinone/menaquinone biosynthesis C-methylase UbiE